MRYITEVKYIKDYKLALTFDNNKQKLVNLENHLSGEIFTPLKEVDYFKTVCLNQDLDTIVWENGADISPDFLYEIGEEIKSS